MSRIPSSTAASTPTTETTEPSARQQPDREADLGSRLPGCHRACRAATGPGCHRACRAATGPAGLPPGRAATGPSSPTAENRTHHAQASWRTASSPSLPRSGGADPSGRTATIPTHMPAPAGLTPRRVGASVDQPCRTRPRRRAHARRAAADRMAMDGMLVVALQRDVAGETADVGHLAMQELVLRRGRAAGYARTLSWRRGPGEPRWSADVGLSDSAPGRPRRQPPVPATSSSVREIRASPSASSVGGGQPKPRRKKARGRSNQ